LRIFWSLEEMILAANVADGLQWRGVNAKTPQVVELSILLQAARYHPTSNRDENFRSVNSVGMKINNLKASHPSHVGVGLRVSEAEISVVEMFVDEPRRMRSVASKLKDRIRVGQERLGDAKRFLAE